MTFTFEHINWYVHWPVDVIIIHTFRCTYNKTYNTYLLSIFVSTLIWYVNQQDYNVSVGICKDTFSSKTALFDSPLLRLWGPPCLAVFLKTLNVNMTRTAMSWVIRPLCSRVYNITSVNFCYYNIIKNDWCPFFEFVVRLVRSSEIGIACVVFRIISISTQNMYVCD